MVDDDVSCAWCEIGRNRAGTWRTETPRGGKFSVVEHGPWSFTTFNTSERTSTRPPGKPRQTPEQIIIRQLCCEQKRRTRGQVSRPKLRHSEAVGTGEQRIAGPRLIKFRA